MDITNTLNLTKTMRSVKQNIRPSYLDSANNESPYNFEVHYEYLESNMKLNELKQKRNERNLWTDSLNSKNKTSQKELNVL